MNINKDIIAYYNSTQNHYEKWWKLKHSHALHYGIWDQTTSNFKDALLNTNQILCNKAKIKSNDVVLDAGCGIGGSSLYLAKHADAKVLGISLSQKQINHATQLANELQLNSKVEFQVADYTKTELPDNSFDVIWAIESVCHATDKADFIKEAYRLLKKGGRLIMSDFFLTNQNQIDKNRLIDKWCATWSVPNLISSDNFCQLLNKNGFESYNVNDFTYQIEKSASLMHKASILGAIPSELYNLTHPKVNRYAKTHYKCGYYQYKALKADLWKYKVILATK